jgi:hypothetical protein
VSNLLFRSVGTPQRGSVGLRRYTYYSLDLSSFDQGTITDLTITLTNSVGDSDIYMTNDGQLPNTTYFRWSATSVQTDQIHVVSPASAIYLIGIYGYSSSNYTLVASTGIVALQEGISFRTNVTLRQWRYFSFFVSNPSM